MERHVLSLTGDSAGTQRTMTLYRYGAPGAAPKIYLQAGLHADEMPGVLILQKLLNLLDAAEAEGRLRGEVLVVPTANPIGLAQWAYNKPLGRFEAESMENSNRGYPELAALTGDMLEDQLTGSEAENCGIVRAAFRAVLADFEARSDLQQMRLMLLSLSCDADYVLDLHCDHHSVVHLYAPTVRSEDTSLLCRSVGAKLALITESSGGNAFDEAHSAAWALLQRRFDGRFPIPDGCFSTTLEYRGQFDVDDQMAALDAAHLMTFMACIGAVTDEDATPAFADPPHYPLAGTLQILAPLGGVVTWAVPPGEWVAMDQVLGHITDPATRQRLALHSPIDGILFRIELWPSCLRGQSLCHIAGAEAVRSGNLILE